jgi:hypothetical protein
MSDNFSFSVTRLVSVLIIGLLCAFPALATEPPSKAEAQRMRQVMAMTGSG